MIYAACLIFYILTNFFRTNVRKLWTRKTIVFMKHVSMIYQTLKLQSNDIKRHHLSWFGEIYRQTCTDASVSAEYHLQHFIESRLKHCAKILLGMDTFCFQQHSAPPTRKASIVLKWRKGTFALLHQLIWMVGSFTKFEAIGWISGFGDICYESWTTLSI